MRNLAAAGWDQYFARVRNSEGAELGELEFAHQSAARELHPGRCLVSHHDV